MHDYNFHVNNRGWADIGYHAAETGVATVTGTGASWTNNMYLRVGASGTGALTIRDGGSVFNWLGFVAQQSSATGFVTVINKGSVVERIPSKALLPICKGSYCNKTL